MFWCSRGAWMCLKAGCWSFRRQLHIKTSTSFPPSCLMLPYFPDSWFLNSLWRCREHKVMIHSSRLVVTFSWSLLSSPLLSSPLQVNPTWPSSRRWTTRGREIRSTRCWGWSRWRTSSRRSSSRRSWTSPTFTVSQRFPGWRPRHRNTRHQHRHTHRHTHTDTHTDDLEMFDLVRIKLRI